MRIFYGIILILFILPSIVFADPVHHLVPFTSTKDLKPCSEYLNEELEFSKTVECASSIIEKSIELSPPECYVITLDSPDVHEGKDSNFISIFMLGVPMIVGFYEDTTEVVYIVENKIKEIKSIYNHEVGHYIIHKVYGMLYLNGDPRHEHDF